MASPRRGAYPSPVRLPPPERRGATALPDGRRLGWSEWGPEGAPVVLYCPGAGQSSFLALDGELVRRRGVRLVALDRPGLGASDPRPGRTLTDWAADVAALIAARALRAPRLIGFSQGGPFALACAAAGCVHSVAVVSGSDRLERFADRLPSDLAQLVALADGDPPAAEAVFSQMSAEAMHRMIAASVGPEDRPIYEAPAFDAALRRALAEGFAQGAAGYARDTVLAMGRWPFALDRIAVPVHVWYGERDASPVHSPDLGADLAALVPGATRRVVPGAGGALPWTHADAILDALLR